DGTCLLPDFGLELDCGIGEIVAFEALVRGQRRIQAKRQRGAKCSGAYQTDHRETPWAADKGRVRHKGARKGDGLMAGGRASERVAKHCQTGSLCRVGGASGTAKRAAGPPERQPTARLSRAAGLTGSNAGLAPQRIFHIGSVTRLLHRRKWSGP